MISKKKVYLPIVDFNYVMRLWVRKKIHTFIFCTVKKILLKVCW